MVVQRQNKMLKARFIVPEVTRTRYPKTQDTPSNTARVKHSRKLFLKQDFLVALMDT